MFEGRMHFELKKYIGLFFVLLYGFPVVYQAVHIIEHQSELRTDHSCCQSHSETTADVISSPENSSEDCPICDYQFTLFEAVNSSISKEFIPQHCELNSFFSYPNVPTYSGNLSSLRAPPVFSSL